MQEISITINHNLRDITLREKSIFESIMVNSTLCNRTLCPQENSSDISDNKILAPSQQRYELIDPFATKSQLNRTPES